MYLSSSSSYEELRVREARGIVEEKFAAPPALKDLARTVGLNRNVLCHGYRILYGETIFESVRRLRLERAAQLLQESNLPIQYIAVKLGYDYPSNFISAFRRAYGVTPKKFRDANRGVAQFSESFSTTGSLSTLA